MTLRTFAQPLLKIQVWDDILYERTYRRCGEKISISPGDFSLWYLRMARNTRSIHIARSANLEAHEMVISNAPFVMQCNSSTPSNNHRVSSRKHAALGKLTPNMYSLNSHWSCTHSDTRRSTTQFQQLTIIFPSVNTISDDKIIS